MAGNFVRGENYLRDDFKRNLLKDSIRKSESKTTTSMKFKADAIDFYGDRFKNKVIVEIGTSLGHGTKILSQLFKKVITVDSSPEKMEYAKNYLSSLKNIEFLKFLVLVYCQNKLHILIVIMNCSFRIFSTYLIKLQ